MASLILTALMFGAPIVYSMMKRRRTVNIPRTAAMEVLRQVVLRTTNTRFELMDDHGGHETVSNVRILGDRPVRAMPFDADPPPRKPQRRERSSSPEAIASRRARADRRALASPTGPTVSVPRRIPPKEDNPSRSDEPAGDASMFARRSTRHQAHLTITHAAAASAVVLLLAGAMYIRAPRAHITPSPSQPAPASVRPTTTAPAGPKLLPVALGGTRATVETPPTYHVTIATHGRCWLRVRNTDTGDTAEETLDTDTVRQLDLSGPSEIRLGNVSVVEMSVDAQPLPLGGQGPGAYDVVFTASATPS
jgi:hypothetical protein